MSTEMITFIQAQWWLIAIAIGLIIWISIDLYIDQKQKSIIITVDEAAQLAARNNVLFIDLRHINAYASGHIIGAVSASDQTINDTIKNHPHYDTYILYSDKTSQSTKQASRLAASTGKNFRFLKGGINAWLAENYPVHQK